jgi:glycosyltransferase involved in cell wall biosynthesis
MKIALYFNLTPGGADKALSEIVKRLRKDHQIDLYTYSGPKSNKLLINSLKLKRFNYQFKKPSNLLSYLYFIYLKYKRIHKELAAQINKKDYDLVLLAEDYLTKSPYLLWFLTKPTVYFCQSHYREFYDPQHLFSHSLKLRLINILRYPLKLADSKSVNCASMVIANSKYLQTRLTNIYKRKIEKITLGVNQPNISSFDNRKDFFLCVGPLTIFKGMAFIIKSIALLPKKYKKPLVIVANDGRDKQYIIKLAKNLNVNLIIKRGVWKGANNKELVKLYREAKLFLYAPYFEPLGLVALEAMSYGLPVVGINQGGVKETVVDNQNGFLCPRNISKFKNTIIKALNAVDLQFRKKTYFSTKAWSWDKSSRQMNLLLKKAIKEKQ